MSLSSQESFAPFAQLSAASVPMPRQRSWFVQMFVAPFHDIDDRAARLAAATKRERDARKAAMSGAGAR